MEGVIENNSVAPQYCQHNFLKRSGPPETISKGFGANVSQAVYGIPLKC